MKKTAILMALAMVAGVASAAIIRIDGLDVRSTGVFGHDPNVSDITINGAAPTAITADPIDVKLTYSNLDLDGDASANDAVTFTLRAATGATPSPRTMNQGIDTGFGNLTALTFTMLSVSGTTTDLGHNIVFDGFVGATVASGANAALDHTVEVNGTLVDMTYAATGAFQFKQQFLDFSPTASVLYDNTTGTSGSLVARAHDLQFSTVVPEPATFGLLGAFGGAILFIRRRFMI